jgi:hypothetical protein
VRPAIYEELSVEVDHDMSALPHELEAEAFEQSSRGGVVLPYEGFDSLKLILIEGPGHEQPNGGATDALASRPL